MVNMKKLKNRCLQTRESLFAECDKVVGGRNTHYAFKDNGSNILAVAHVDTVITEPHFAHSTYTFKNKKGHTRNRTIAYSPQLDDRLGVFTIMDYLPAMGIKLDVLLTDYEECGQTTATYFEPEKDYNWLVEFDRRGTGAVCYQYYEMGLCAEEIFKMHRGSFSDISAMDHLGIGGLNVGVAYYDEHTYGCHAKMWEYGKQIRRFKHFYREYKDVKIDYEIPTYNTGRKKTGVIESSNIYESVNWDHTCSQCHWEFDDDETVACAAGVYCPYCGYLLKHETYEAQGEFIDESV